jgi:hypothetical protein
MRIRQVKPSFFTDGTMAGVSYAARLFYIGLWCVADDAGWLRWDPMEIGALLYPYDAPGKRLRQVTTWAVELQGCGRLRILDCGCALVPTLEMHQRVGGTKTFTARTAHEKHGSPEAVPQNIRQQVMARDQWTCRYCGQSPEPRLMVAEHVINGGPTTLDNLVAACRSCNVRKGTKTYEDAGMSMLPEPMSRDIQTFPSGSSNGMERKGKGTVDARDVSDKDDDGPSDFRRLVPRPGAAGVH